MSQAVLDILNAARVDHYLPAYRWDDRLAAAAQEECDNLAHRIGHVHDGMVERLRKAGWPYDIMVSPRRHRAGMPGNASEGWLGTTESTVEDAARQWIDTMRRMPPWEGHRKDWEADYNRVGVGFTPGNFVIMYGFEP
jgi:hypothetical protein